MRLSCFNFVTLGLPRLTHNRRLRVRIHSASRVRVAAAKIHARPSLIRSLRLGSEYSRARKEWDRALLPSKSRGVARVIGNSFAVQVALVSPQP